MPRMKAAVFVASRRIVLDAKPISDIGPIDALVKGEYPVTRADHRT